MITYLDLDYTIYDTARMEDNLRAVLTDVGVSKKDFDETYWKSLCTHSRFTYDYYFEEQFDLLRALGHDLPESVLEKMHATCNDSYLYDGAVELISYLQAKSRVILLSAGDMNFQMEKIRGTGADKLVEEIQIVSGNEAKREFVNTRSLGSDFIFVNDNLRENLLVQEAFPKGKIVTKKNDRKYSAEDYAKSGLPTFENLFDIKNYVSTIIK